MYPFYYYYLKIVKNNFNIYVTGLCRHNEDALKQLEITSFLPVLLKLLQMPDERLRAKTAFFLSHLASKENFRGNSSILICQFCFLKGPLYGCAHLFLFFLK